MTYPNTIDGISAMSKHIAKHHSEFAGHFVHKSGARVFATLIKACDYLTNESAAVSTTFSAVLNQIDPETLAYPSTEITLVKYGDGWMLLETVANA